MAQPSKVGPIILTLFALPFLGAGLFFLYTLLVTVQNVKTGNATVGVAISLFLVLIGGGLIFASFKGYELQKQKATLEAANPLSPWLWRTDWAGNRAESLSQKSYIGAWVLAALGNLFLFPFLFGMVPQLLRQADFRVILVLAFCSVGIFLFVRAIRATIRHDRFGNSYFELDSLPFSPGEHCPGESSFASKHKRLMASTCGLPASAASSPVAARIKAPAASLSGKRTKIFLLELLVQAR